MTVSSETSRWEYEGDGSTKSFTYNNRIFQDSDLEVYTDGSLATDYTVTGAGSSSGGEVQFDSAPADGTEIVIIRNVSNTQGSDYPSGGPLSSDTLEDDFDRRTIVSQEIQEILNRTIKIPKPDQGSPTVELDNKATRADRFLKFDASGNVTTTATTPDSFAGKVASGETAISQWQDQVSASFSSSDTFTVDADITGDHDDSNGNTARGWGVGDRVKVSGSSTGTVTGTINSIDYNSTNADKTTVELASITDSTGASATLSNESLTAWVGIVSAWPATSSPAPIWLFPTGGDDSTRIKNALDTGHPVRFMPMAFKMNSGISLAADDVDVDFGAATITCDFSADGVAFLFGTSADTPQHTGLKVRGGTFQLQSAAATDNVQYIKIEGTKKFSVSGVRCKNVSNGGIVVTVGSEDGDIYGNTIDGTSGNATNRGIWLTGGGASDFASQLVDTSSITRNATAVPEFGVKNVRIYNNTCVLAGYGIYLINAHDCHIESNYIDISGSGLRCITLNNYAPGALVAGNTLRGDQASTGLLATQFSHDVIIERNTFLGSFGGGRDIYVSYLADAVITGNRFNTDSTQQIQMEMGGTFVAHGNTFTRASGYSASTRVVLADTIDNTAGAGDTATVLQGFVFRGNTVKKRLQSIKVQTPTSDGGTIPGLGPIVVRGNEFYDFDEATAGGEFPLNIDANGSANVVSYSYFDNVVFPEGSADRNKPLIATGTGFTEIRSGLQWAVFEIDVSSGAVTVTKRHGGNFSCGTSRSGDSLVASPRTINNATGAAVALLASVSDEGGNSASYTLEKSSNDYVLKLFDSADSQITLSSTDATVRVTVVGEAT